MQVFTHITHISYASNSKYLLALFEWFKLFKLFELFVFNWKNSHRYNSMLVFDSHYSHRLNSIRMILNLHKSMRGLESHILKMLFFIFDHAYYLTTHIQHMATTAMTGRYGSNTITLKIDEPLCDVVICKISHVTKSVQ